MPELLNSGDGTRRFGEGEEAGGQSFKAGGEAGGLGVNEALDDRVVIFVAMSDEGGYASVDLISKPDVEVVETGEDRCFPVEAVALANGSGLGVDFGVIGCS